MAMIETDINMYTLPIPYAISFYNSSMCNLTNCAFFIDMNSQSVWIMIHSHHIPLIHNSVLFREISLCKCLFLGKCKPWNRHVAQYRLTTSSETSPSFLPISLWDHSSFLSLEFDMSPGTTRGIAFFVERVVTLIAGSNWGLRIVWSQKLRRWWGWRSLYVQSTAA